MERAGREEVEGDRKAIEGEKERKEGQIEDGMERARERSCKSEV